MFYQIQVIVNDLMTIIGRKITLKMEWF